MSLPLKRKLLVLLLVLALHALAVGGLAMALQQRSAPKPEQPLAQETVLQAMFISPPTAAAPPPPDTSPPPAPPPPRPRPPPPAPAPPPVPVPAPTPLPAPTPAPTALPPAPAVAAATAAAKAPESVPAPSATYAPSASPAPAPPTPATPAPPASAAAPLQLPSTNADYLNNPRPPYPALSRRLGEQGRVLVRVLIEADGRPSKVELQESSGYDRLDQTALQTVMRWRYVPGKRGDEPEAMWFSVPIQFVLE